MVGLLSELLCVQVFIQRTAGTGNECYIQEYFI